MSQPTVWNSPRIPDAVVDDENVLFDFRALVEREFFDDEPKIGDMRAIFERYNEGSSLERDAIDAAFVWMTGYTLPTLCAKAVTKPGGKYEETLSRWRDSG